MRAAVSRQGTLEHVRRLESIAESNGGNRAAGTPGYDASARYVAERLRDAGYKVTVQRFRVLLPERLSSPTPERWDIGRRASASFATGVSLDLGTSSRERHPPGSSVLSRKQGFDTLGSSHDEGFETTNVIAESRSGSEEDMVVAGAHLDSVAEGPGINDNGSGSAAVLEIAEEMSELGLSPSKKVRFAFWGAEELGLQGSTHYVENLRPREIDEISVYLNFDMLGSPNGVRYIYDNEGNPRGSARIEGAFTEYFSSQDLPSEPDDTLVGRSDHGPFADREVPVGGLFSGAEGTKTPKEAEDYGGESGEPHDPCYHESCDTLQNLDHRLLDEMSDAAASSILRFAEAG